MRNVDLLFPSVTQIRAGGPERLAGCLGSGLAKCHRRQCDPVVRTLALRTGDPGFKTRSDQSENLILVVFPIVFSLSWSVALFFRRHKRKRLHDNRSQVPADKLGTPMWPPFLCLGTPTWSPWRQVKSFYSTSRTFYPGFPHLTKQPTINFISCDLIGFSFQSLH